MSKFPLEIKQIVDYPRCRVYRQFIQTLLSNRSIRLGGGLCIRSRQFVLGNINTPV